MDDFLITFHFRFRLLDPEDVAEATINAILNRESVASVPSSLQYGIKLFNVLPFCLQHFIRDHLRKESSFFVQKS
jgi:hypothetical protein